MLSKKIHPLKYVISLKFLLPLTPP